MLDALHRTVFGPSFDVVMLVYFCLHIPITLFIDAQASISVPSTEKFLVVVDWPKRIHSFWDSRGHCRVRE